MWTAPCRCADQSVDREGAVQFCYDPQLVIFISKEAMDASQSPPRARAEPASLLAELQRSEVPHLDAAHGAIVNPSDEARLRAAVPGGGLPYDLLDPHSFERLCFHLLLARGAAPRFWGRRGQAQQGIDLILSDGHVSTVYQCKHHATFSATALDMAVRKFEQDWLSRPELGRPETFVLCTTARLQDTTGWDRTKRRLSDKLGIAIKEWHRDTLDGWLRDQPGIVADLFGDQIAELFCGLTGNWDIELFRPIDRGFDRHRVNRYLDLVETDQLVRDARDEEAFAEILARSSVVLLEGHAGAGKTMAGLDLAVSHPPSAGRVFYLRADAIESLDRVVTGIKGRAFRPSTFIIDDTQIAFDKVERLVDRVRLLEGATLVLTARTPPPGMDMLDPVGTDFVANLRDGKQTIEIVADARRVAAVVEKKRSGWTAAPIDRVMAWTGRDLAVLDLVLEAVEPTEEINTLEEVFPRVLQLVFGAHSVNAPNLKRLAALAQFDIAVPREIFPEPFEASRNAAAVERFVVAGGAPSALAFRHPSAAELIYRLLAQAHGEIDAVAACANDCVKVLIDCITRYGPVSALGDLLPRLMRTRLNLTDDASIKRALLADVRIIDYVTDKETPLSTLSIATFLSGGRVPSYAARLAERLQALDATPEAAPKNIPLLGLHLRTLRLADPEAHVNLERRIRVEALARLVAAHGDLRALLRILVNSSAWFSRGLLDAFADGDLARLAARTVERGGSVGTLNLALRDLGQRPLPGGDGQSQADLFVARLGTKPMALLVASRGDLSALLKILQHSPAWFAADLLASFEGRDLGLLAERTVEREGSVGTLGIALRELGERPVPGNNSRTQADLFVARLGAGLLARIVAQRGDLSALLGILAKSPSWFAAELLEAFASDDLARLAGRTVEREGSVGTLGVALRALGQRSLPGDQGRTQADLFAARFGARPMARLVTERGDLSALMRILAESPAFFAADLLRSFAGEDLALLAGRTVKKEGSIGTLGLALLQLGERPLFGATNQTQRELFEVRFGIVSLWRLVVGAGDLNHLSYLLDGLSPVFCDRVLASHAAPDVHGWITLARRGTLYGAARFARDSFGRLPSEVAERVRLAIATTAVELTSASSWGEIGSTLAALEQIADTRISAALAEPTNARIDGVVLGDLAFDDYVEAVDCISVLWRNRPTLRPELGARLWQLLPHRERWPHTYQLILKAPFLLRVARTPEVSQDDALRILQAFAPLAANVALDPRSARYHALFLWNLFALWFERGRSLTTSFSDLQSTATWSRFLAVVAKRQHWRRNEDKLNTLQLSGALALLVPSLRPTLIDLVRGRIRGIPHLAQFADDSLTFIPALLVAHGLALSDPPQRIFTAERVLLLLKKAEAYEERGPALDYLCKTFTILPQ